MAYLFGVRIDEISSADLRATLTSWLHSQKGHLLFTPNPEFLLSAKNDPDFQMLLNASDLSIPDGIGLRFAAAALTDTRLTQRQTGVDTLELLAEICEHNEKRLLLLGGLDDVSLDAAESLKKQRPKLDVISIDPGFLPGNHQSFTISDDLLGELQRLRPDVVAVALGQGKQERCCVELVKRIASIRIAIGVGGAFDTLSGRLPRAPKWMRKFGLEWLWRALIQPKRTHRILKASVVFPLVVIWDTLRLRRFHKAFVAVINELKQLGKF